MLSLIQTETVVHHHWLTSAEFTNIVAISQMTPGPIVKTTEEVIQRLQHLEEWFDADQVCRFRDKFMSACDGHATERLLEALKT